MAEGTKREAKSDQHLILYCDGASFGNPGPAGAGFVLETPEGEVVKRGGVPLGVTTNNVAEYRALIAGLGEASALGARRVTVRADSELLVRQLKGRYRVKAEHLRPLYEQARKLIAGFDGVRLENLPREGNAEADSLAKAAARRSRERGRGG